MKLIFSLLLFVSAPAAFANNACGGFFDKLPTSEELVQSLKNNRTPFYMLNVGNRQLPVILVNKDTVASVHSLFDTSVGFEVMSKAGWPNDHGSFRYGQFLIDAFLAGQRQVGETHQTGLSWKVAKDSAIFLDKMADIIGEALIPVTRSEMQSVDFYERVRRAALFRIPFLMGDQSIYANFDNVLSECGGYCFEFSHSPRVDGQLTALRTRLDQMDPNSAVRTQSQDKIANYIEKVRQKFLVANVFDANQLSEAALQTGELAMLARSFVPQEWDARKQQLFLNYLVGEKAVEEMVQVMKSFTIAGNDPFRIATSSARVQAIVVWDPRATADSFNNATYSGRAQTFVIPQGVKP